MKRPVAVACLLVWIACGCYRADVEEPDGGRDAGVADAGVVDAGEPWMPSACMAPPTCRWRARADGTCAEVVEIASGLGYACVLLDDGHVECAGRDVGEDGVLGRGEVVIEDWEPRPVVGIDDAIDLDSDGVRVCVLRASGSVVCWGNDPNRRGEAFPTPEEVARIPGAVRLAMTYVFGCVLTERREVWCWRGYGAPTVLGVGLSLDATETGPVRVLDDATGVWAAQRMACAASESAGLVCWGSDAGLLFYEPSPVRLFGSLETVHAGVGFAVVCVAAVDGTVSCWGDNNRGRLGTGDDVDRSEPGLVVGMSDAVEVSVSGSHCARRRDGTVACWGATGAYGIAGTRDLPRTAIVLPSIRGAERLSAVAAWTSAGLELWGLDVIAPDRLPRVRVDFEAPPRAIAARARHFCAVRDDERVACWGRSFLSPDASDDDVLWYDTPRIVEALGGASRVEVGSRFACAITGEGETRCWGAVPLEAEPHEEARTVARLSGAEALALGARHGCALSLGRMRCIGEDDAGQLGETDADGHVRAIDDVRVIAATRAGTCALARDGVLRCWGELPGLGAIGAAPRELARDVVELASSDDALCWRDTGDRVLCLGRVGAEAGDPAWPGHTTPTELAWAAPVDELAVASHLCVRSGGAIACLGANGHHEIDLDDAPATTMRESRAPCSSDLATADRATCALDANGTVWCWGEDATHFSAPVLIRPWE